MLGSEVVGWFSFSQTLYPICHISPFKENLYFKEPSCAVDLAREFALLHLKVTSNFFGSSIGKLNVLSMVVLEILHGDFYLALKCINVHKDKLVRMTRGNGQTLYCVFDFESSK